MLKFTAEIRIMANMPEDAEMQKTFMKNAEDVIQKGLEKMTVPDWKATVVNIEEEEDFFL